MSFQHRARHKGMAATTETMAGGWGGEWALPASLEGEAGGVPAVAAQRAEGPRDELHAGVVCVPEVDVLVGDLQLALAVHVQVGTGQQEDVEAIWRGEDEGAWSFRRVGGSGGGVTPPPPCANTRPHLSAHTALLGPGGLALPD